MSSRTADDFPYPLPGFTDYEVPDDEKMWNLPGDPTSFFYS